MLFNVLSYVIRFNHEFVEYKEMSFVCFCVPCAVIVAIEEALMLIWLASSYMQWYALSPAFLKLSIWLIDICKILAKVIGKLLKDLDIYLEMLILV